MTVQPPGWYPDPEMAQTQRYWDGHNWTDHRAPAAQQATTGHVRNTTGGVIAIIITSIVVVLIVAGLLVAMLSDSSSVY